jgi:hypothetical protein
MKKILKYLCIALLALMLFFLGFYLVKNENLPTGTANTEADQLALSMLSSLNKTAWDSTEVVSWTFRGNHNYIWNKSTNTVTATWGNYEVEFNTQTLKGTVKDGDFTLIGEEAKQLINKAKDNFNNDSFWLAAPYKVFDSGTKRSIITTKDGRTGLMITYTSGGTTPGDSYAWILDENYRPISVKMWVSIIPVGGIEFTWENYQTLKSGALIARDHKLFGSLNIEVTNISD